MHLFQLNIGICYYDSSMYTFYENILYLKFLQKPTWILPTIRIVLNKPKKALSILYYKCSK